MNSAATHSNSPQATSLTIRRLALALVITLAFVVVEALAGWYANSLALLTDAAHNFTDVIALGLSWYALRLTTRPAHAGKTFGYHRAGILIALLNSTTLVVIALGIFYEAYRRLVAPPQVEAGVLIVVAAIAFVVNVGTALLVRRGSENDLNLRSAFVHLAGDAVSTLGAILAGIGIALTGMAFLDPLASILIGALILWNAWGILRESVEILLESTPRDVDLQAMVGDLMRLPGVRGVHDLHVWSITQNMRALSAHILTDDTFISEGATVQREINALLRDKYGIAHAALQLECAGCEPDLLYCDLVAVNNHSHEERADS
jgi:cobalt-zinc-cadmium efflux system protein